MILAPPVDTPSAFESLSFQDFDTLLFTLAKVFFAFKFGFVWQIWKKKINKSVVGQTQNTHLILTLH